MSENETPAAKNRTRLIVAVALLIGAVILLFATEWGSVVGKREATPPPPPPPATKSTLNVAPPSTPAHEVVAEPGPTAQRAFAASPIAPPQVDPTERPIISDTLNRPDSDARVDVSIISNLLTYYLQQFKELPVGNNAEITAALAGDNPRGYAVIDARHSAINTQGELTDRWGTPYFFHQLSSTVMEVRSSGPDKMRYTADDILWPAHNPEQDAAVAQLSE